MAGALVATLIVSPPSAEFRRIIQPSQVTQFFRERMFPQNGWFQSRVAQTAATPEQRQTAAAASGAVSSRPE
jgi:hypothetical protein